MVTRERRRKEIEPMMKVLERIQEVDHSYDKEIQEFKKTTKNLFEFATKVDRILGKFVKSDKNWFYNLLLKL